MNAIAQVSADTLGPFANEFSNPATLARAVRRSQRFLRPPQRLAPSEWAERNIYIPVGNAVPGLIRFDNAPYQREPLDMTADPTCRRISLMWGAQVGKTQLALCSQGYFVAQDPCSQMMMQPSQGDLQTWLETKFSPMVDANPSIEEVLAKPRARDGVNNQRMKSYPGGFMMFAWAGSPKTMRGRSAPKIFADEIDGYDRTAEGHPVNLLWQRAATFGDQRMLLEISTPTIAGASAIELAFEAGDKRRYHIVCPHCGAVQWIKWENVRWQKGEGGEHLPATAYLMCEESGCEITDRQRIAAIKSAEADGAGWIAEKPFKGHASYHLSELYSCFRALSDIVESFLEKKATNDLQTFYNVSLAQTWREQAEELSVSDIMRRVETYKAPVPRGVGVLTAGVDMQEDRLELEVVGWGVGEESWSIEHKVFWGDPLEDDVWAELFDYLGDRVFRTESGALLKIAATCVDTGGSGGLTQSAYEHLRGKQKRKIFAIKGVGGWNRPIVGTPSKSKPGRRVRPVTLFPVGVDEAKLVVMRRLKIEAGPGACHFPDDREPEYFEQFTGEQIVTKFVKGYPFREWRKVRERNEALDIRVYAYAALKLERPNIEHRLARLQPAELEDLGDIEDERDGSSGEVPEDKPTPKKKNKSRYGALRSGGRRRLRGKR